jgi:hypothetical protein
MNETTIPTPPAPAAGSAILGVPPECVEAPGYILDLFDGSAWMTQDGRVTDKWNERGVWPTAESASEAMRRFLYPNPNQSGGSQ